MRNAWNEAKLAVAAGFATDPLIDRLWTELQRLERDLAAERHAHADTRHRLAEALGEVPAVKSAAA
jgi:hypothetical protein